MLVYGLAAYVEVPGAEGVDDVDGGPLARQRGELQLEVYLELGVLGVVDGDVGPGVHGPQHPQLHAEQGHEEEHEENGEDSAEVRALGELSGHFCVQVHALERAPDAVPPRGAYGEAAACRCFAQKYRHRDVLTSLPRVRIALPRVSISARACDTPRARSHKREFRGDEVKSFWQCFWPWILLITAVLTESAPPASPEPPAARTFPTRAQPLPSTTATPSGPPVPRSSHRRRT